jgi:hypothetical protein
VTFFLNYLYNVMVALSQLVNTVLLFGDPDESISGRIGKSIVAGGWAAHVPWPEFMRAHWLASVETEEGGNSAASRSERA